MPAYNKHFFGHAVFDGQPSRQGQTSNKTVNGTRQGTPNPKVGTICLYEKTHAPLF